MNDELSKAFRDFISEVVAAEFEKLGGRGRPKKDNPNITTEDLARIYTPCSHCGGQAMLRKRKYNSRGWSSCFYVQCMTCGYRSSVKGSKTDSIAAWERDNQQKPLFAEGE